MRRKPRVDSNHHAIVFALRQSGCSVLSLAAIGNGCPDLLAGKLGVNLLIECKDGCRSPSRRVLTDEQLEFLDGWRGTAVVVESPEEALAMMANAILEAKGTR
jgi:Holliday junction resolvase